MLFKVSFTSQTSGSNNKLDIGTFKLGHPRLTNSKTNNKRHIGTFKLGHRRLTLNEGSKVKSDHSKRFPAHEFLQVGYTFQTSRTNNKQDIGTFKFGYPRLTLNKGLKVKSYHI